MRFSENVRQIEASSTLAIAARCRELRAQGRDIIDLGVGEPDFRTPGFIAQAGITSIEEGRTQYTPVPGIAPLREAIAASLATATGRKTDAAGVVTTSGAKQAIFNVCFTLFGPGEEVLLPVPYWTSYPALIRLARAEPRYVPTTAEQGFKATVEDLERAYSPRVRGLIINSPSNPTGSVYTKDELAQVAAWAHERGIWVISDEIYGRICFSEPRAASLLDVVDSLDHSVIIDGASKAFAMTGWRLGFSYTDRLLADKLIALQSQITSGASSPAQYAALTAYRDAGQADAAVHEMVSTFRQRRDRVLELMRQEAPDVYCFEPDGAFYLFLRVDDFYSSALPDSDTFCRWLLEETDVAAVPGSAFGDDAWIRTSIAASTESLERAFSRIGKVLQAAPSRA